jgi:hypothetical protein
MKSSLSKTTVRIASAPAGEPVSSDYEVRANGQPVPVYQAHVAAVTDGPAWTLPAGSFGGRYSFASFDASGPVEVEVRALGRDLSRTVIRPSSCGMCARHEDGVLKLSLERPVRLSIEPDGRNVPLFLFVNQPEEQVPCPGPTDPGILHFGPGFHEAGTIEVGSGRTVYLAAGAVVRGRLVIRGENVTVRGRGILCGHGWNWPDGPKRLVDISHSRNVRIEGIIIRGAPCWTIVPADSEDVTVTNVKICGARNPNDDGINPCNSRRVTVRDCFIRTDDDCIAIKGIERRTDGPDAVENITVEDCVLWADRARAVLVGHECQAARMADIHLHNLDVIHCSMTPLLVEPGENMPVEDLVAGGVRIHAEGWRPAFDHEDELDPQSRKWDFIALHPSVNFWMKDKVPGCIRRVVLRDIHLEGTNDARGYRLWIGGSSDRHSVQNVHLQNITAFGEPLRPEHPLVEIGPFTRNIHFSTTA